MRRHPRDWRIADLEIIAACLGISVRKHGGGSHVIFHHPNAATKISVPAHKPVKPVYIKMFLALVDDIKE
jgi:hypothetical protein